MRLGQFICVVAALAFATSASAFEEQRQGAPAPAAKAVVQPDQPAPVTAPVTPQGTEVRVPGFGKLGVLPKIDFGLELLYGGSEAQRQAAPSVPAGDPTDGMAVRGSFRHKF